MSELEKQYKRLDISIKYLKWFLVALMLILTYVELSKHSICLSDLSYSCFANFFSEIAEITKKTIPLLAALLATLVADRHLTQAIINRDNEQIFEIVQITHRYIAIANDLHSKVIYLQKMFNSGTHTISSFIVVANSIEKRYESFFEKESYKYLSGDTVNTINAMSGSISGVLITISNLSVTFKNDLSTKLPSINQAPLDNLLEEIDKLKDDLYTLRKSVDSN